MSSKLRDLLARWAADGERQRVLDRQAFNAWSERMNELRREYRGDTPGAERSAD